MEAVQPRAERTVEGFSRERAMEAAEELFGRKGFTSVTLRDIASALGLSHASLYYHFPGGKEELFVAVTRRGILRHGQAIARMLGVEDADIRAKLRELASWLLAHPPLDLIRMSESDMPALSVEHARELTESLHRLILVPVTEALAAADRAGEIRCPDPSLVGGAIVGMTESFHSIPDFAVRGTRSGMAWEMIDIVLRGLAYRGSKPDDGEART